MTTRRVDKHLIDEERVLVSTRHHPIVAVWPMPASLVLLILVAAITARVPVGNPLIDVLWYGWLASVGYVGWRLLEWSNEVFVVTDRRVMLFSGFLTQRVAMMPLVKVTDLTYRRTVGGRLFRYGDFVIESAGQDQALHLVRFLPNPDDLYHDIAGTLFGRGGGRAGEPRARKATRLPPMRRQPVSDPSPADVGAAEPRPGSWRSWRRDTPDSQPPPNPTTVRAARPEERTSWRLAGHQPSGAATPASGPTSRSAAGSGRTAGGAATGASDQGAVPGGQDMDDTATLDRIED